jgi:hypothetical protein
VHRACAGAGLRKPDESNPTDILDWGKALVKAGARLSPSEKRKVNGGNCDEIAREIGRHRAELLVLRQ